MLQERGAFRAHLDQQSSGIVAQRPNDGRQAGLVFHRAQGRTIEHFNGGHRLLLEADDGLAGGLDGGEEHQRARLAGVLDDGAVGNA